MICAKCSKPMQEKSGRFGPFMGCTGYPSCKNIVKIKGAKAWAEKTVQATSIEPLQNPSQEQEAIFKAAESRQDMLIDARAGTGKTTSLAQLVRIYAKMGLSIMVLAFAKRDQKALDAKAGNFSKVSTSHSAGFAILNHWARKQGRRVNKTDNVAFSMLWQRLKDDGRIPQNKDEKWTISRCAFHSILGLADKARNTLPLEANHTPKESDWFDLADRFDFDMPQDSVTDILHYTAWLFGELCSLKNALIYGVDYTGMIFLPVYHQLQPEAKYDVVMVDEGQDQNFGNRGIALLYSK